MSTTFSIEDIRRLEKTVSIREQLIDNLLKTELPTKARDLDAFVNLLDSTDNCIFNKAKISLDEANNKVNEETKEVLRDLLLDLHRTNNSQDNNTNSNTPPVYNPTGINVSEGELIPKIDHSSKAE